MSNRLVVLSAVVFLLFFFSLSFFVACCYRNQNLAKVEKGCIHVCAERVLVDIEEYDICRFVSSDTCY